MIYEYEEGLTLIEYCIIFFFVFGPCFFFSCLIFLLEHMRVKSS